MNIRLNGNGLDVTNAIRDYIERKFVFLNKFVADDTVCELEISKTNEKTDNENLFKAEINISSKNIFIVSEKPDLYEAIDDLKDDLEQVLVSKKEKQITLFKRGAIKVKNILKGLYEYPISRVRKFRKKS